MIKIGFQIGCKYKFVKNLYFNKISIINLFNSFRFYDMPIDVELQSVICHLSDESDICHLSDGSSESDLTDRMTDSSADETDDLNHLILNLILYILNNMHFKFY